MPVLPALSIPDWSLKVACLAQSEGRVTPAPINRIPLSPLPVQLPTAHPVSLWERSTPSFPQLPGLALLSGLMEKAGGTLEIGL